MKIILLKFFALVSLCLIVKTLYIHLNRDNLFIGYSVQQKAQELLLEKNKDKYTETLILGDSLASFNISANKIEGSALNLSLYGASYIENFFTLKRFLEKYSPPKRIILSNSWNWNHKIEDEFWVHFVRNDFYSKEELLKIFQDREHPYFTYSKYYLYRYDILGISTYQLQNFFYNQKLISSNNHIVQGIFLTTNGSTNYKFPFPNRAMWQNYHKDYLLTFDANKTNTSYFVKFLELAKRSNIEVHFFEGPIMKEYQAAIGKASYIDGYYDLIKNFEKDSLLTFHRIDQNLFTKHDFFDATHLIESGANKYTTYISNILSNSP